MYSLKKIKHEIYTRAIVMSGGGYSSVLAVVYFILVPLNHCGGLVFSVTMLNVHVRGN